MEKKKQNPVLLGLCVILTVFTIVLDICTAISSKDSVATFALIAWTCVSFLVLYYILVGYKKPHGNMLRYLLLIMAAVMVIDTFDFSETALYTPLRAATVLLIAYIAGRLGKINQNKILMPIVWVLIIISGCMLRKLQPSTDILKNISFFLDTIIWFVTCAAYFVRYKEHKEAGLTDK